MKAAKKCKSFTELNLIYQSNCRTVIFTHGLLRFVYNAPLQSKPRGRGVSTTVDWSLRLGDQSKCTNMALSQVEFGEEIQSRCFHFEKGFTFVNHGSFGVVPTPIREKQKQ